MPQFTRHLREGHDQELFVTSVASGNFMLTVAEYLRASAWGYSVIKAIYGISRDEGARDVTEVTIDGATSRAAPTPA